MLEKSRIKLSSQKEKLLVGNFEEVRQIWKVGKPDNGNPVESLHSCN